ncbi:hypothetical protein SAMN04488514_101471 [Kriegella aquimaris]|uniref:Uncharacterized protein n=1 Tax=Kriegella aquimaris TaxID=192904 RepID=A0A1G9JA02_9FLAO|nr:hypothetical protein SAMN04488514_101471 [Kriegella aquimaris]
MKSLHKDFLEVNPKIGRNQLFYILIENELLVKKNMLPEPPIRITGSTRMVTS